MSLPGMKDGKTVIAVPSLGSGGLDAPVSAHFGHCDVFTLVTLNQESDGSDCRIVPGIPHEHGGCMAPVRLLTESGANVMIAVGMGRRPLLGFAQVGIRVFHCGDASTVGEAVSAFRSGGLMQFDVNQACGDHHH